MADVSLLADNASKRELAISEAVAAWYAVPNSLLVTIWDPAKCPDALVPYLAWAVGLPLWSERWDVLKKRSVVAAWIAISRLRGTKVAFEKCLGIVDAEFVSWVTPPAICAPRAARTPAQRAAYQAQFPEVRVYLFAKRAVRKGILVCGRPFSGVRRSPQASTAYLRRAYRAEYVDGGVTTDLAIRVLAPTEITQGAFELALPTGTRRLVPGRPWFGRSRFLETSTAATRVFRYTDGDGRPDLLWPTLTPFALQPTLVSQPHILKGHLVAGRPWFGRRRAPLASVADQFVYQSIRLYDPDRHAAVSAGKPGGWILGRTQLGTDAFRIDVAVDTSYRSPGRRFMPGRPLGGVAHAHDPGRIQDVCAALRAAKLGRDKVMLRTGIYREVEAADALPPDGSILPGQIIRTVP